MPRTGHHSTRNFARRKIPARMGTGIVHHHHPIRLRKTEHGQFSISGDDKRSRPNATPAQRYQGHPGHSYILGTAHSEESRYSEGNLVSGQYPLMSRPITLASWFLLAALILVAQSALAPAMEIRGARPDFILLLVACFSLHTGKLDAVVVAWLIGFAADFLTIERPGLLAASYGFSAALIVALREFLFARKLLTLIVVTFFLSLFIRTFWLLYRRTFYSLDESAGAAALDILAGALYTAACAILVHPLLRRFLRPPGARSQNRFEPLPHERGTTRV
jgi:rod shape-determining protein MreD